MVRPTRRISSGVVRSYQLGSAPFRKGPKYSDSRRTGFPDSSAFAQASTMYSIEVARSLASFAQPFRHSWWRQRTFSYTWSSAREAGGGGARVPKL